MVQIAPLLNFALSTAAQIRAGNTSPNGLVVRQAFDPSSLPTACQDPCNVINTMTDCGSSTSCICASTVGSELQQCMSCLVSADPDVQSSAQGAIDSWNELCGGSLTISGGSSSGSTPSAAPASATAVSVAATTPAGNTVAAGATTTKSTATTSAGSSSGSSSNPLGAGSGGALGLKAAGVVVGIVAAFVGGLMVL
ncbi:hypothetical protein BU15DRAFT_71466 [Melanogaster broomeanus]|nr:hypothetical protein BU15DRAFT_71466 [Melanogaster broomeanus]